MNNCFSIYHTSWITSGPKSNFIGDNIPTKAILFFVGCSEVNSTWLITSELAKYYSLVWYILNENSQWFCILVCNFFTAKHYLSRCRSTWENLDRSQYRFHWAHQIREFGSPCATEPHNHQRYYTTKLLIAGEPLRVSILFFIIKRRRQNLSDVRLKTCEVDCVFYIRAFRVRGVCECTWKYRSIS